jgi:hypothetical protein
VLNLPPEAMTWRKDALPPSEEHTALVVEQLGAWASALVALQTAKPGKRVPMPARLEIQRPGAAKKRPKNVVSIAEFVARNRAQRG